MDRKFSIIIPVYNRPDEIDELLASLVLQHYKQFEVIVVEDGSTIKCDNIIEKYIHDLDIQYCYKENEGQGFARNYGYDRSGGDYFIVFDSDCIIPPQYLQEVNAYLNQNYLDAYGGPDRAHKSFTNIQKAINYSMTSMLTTGGIRGKKNKIGPYHPRSFNMGISRDVYKITGGYIIPFKGEDIEFSIRINKMGFKTGLIEEAFVYHKRRTSLIKFFRQLFFFGTARINIARFFPEQLKLIHLFPAIFLIGIFLSVLLFFLFPPLFIIAISFYLIYAILIFIHAGFTTGNIIIALLSILTSFIQLVAYGSGLMVEYLFYGLKKNIPEHH